MQIQLSTEFALHGLLYLALNQKSSPIQLPEVAAAIKVKESYLRKLFQQLVKSGILDAYKGSGGGYTLRLRPDQVSFGDIMEAIEGMPGNFRCYYNRRACELHPDCQILSGFEQAFAAFLKRLKQITLADVLQRDFSQVGKVKWIRAQA